MSVAYYGDFAEDDTVNLPFNTFDSNDPSNSVTATDLVASDIFVHKDGSATPITTDGATIDIDAPGVGAHMITIDTSVDADYSTGSEYAVRVNGVTVDGGTVNAWIGAFSIERAGGALAVSKTIKAETVLIVADTDELQGDWVDAGRLDAILDLILADTGELQADDTPTAIAALQTDLDTLTAGCTLAAGAITNASLAGNMEIVFETDFATNYNVTRNAWVTNFTDIIGTYNAQTGDTFALANGAAGFVAIDTVVDATQALAAGSTGFAAIDTVVDEILVDTAVIGAAGAGLTAINLPNQTMDITGSITGNLSGSVGSVTGAVGSVTGAVGSVAGNVDGNVTGSVGSNLELGPSEVNTQVDTALTDIHLDHLMAAAAADVIVDGSVIAHMVSTTEDWSTFVPSTDSLQSIRDKQTDIEADTNELQTDDYPTSIAAVQTTVDNIETQIGTAGAGLGDLGGMATAMKAEILVEVNAALDTAMAELSVAKPSATPTVRTGLMLLYMALRNKTDVNTTASPDVLEIHNDAGTIIATKDITDDGTDYSEAEMASG